MIGNELLIDYLQKIWAKKETQMQMNMVGGNRNNLTDIQNKAGYVESRLNHFGFDATVIIRL